MNNIKKIAASVLLWGPMIAMAGTMGPAQQSSSAWEVGANALYLQPSFGGNGLGYGVYSNYNGADNNGVQLGVSGAQNPIHNIQPKWGWGLQVEAGYRLDTANDLDVNWYHLDDSSTARFGPTQLLAGSADGFYATSQRVSSKWDAIMLDFGHRAPFSASKMMRFYAGLAFARIKNIFVDSPIITQGSPIGLETNETLVFNGFGPRLGGRLDYTVIGGLGAYANGAVSLLVGSTKQNVTGYRDLTTAQYGLLTYGIANFSQSRNGVVVPALEAKLGLNYVHVLPQGQLTADVGYLWMDYLQAVVNQTGVGIVGSTVETRSSANYNLNGLYFGLKWTGA